MFRILVVDDDKNIRFVMKEILEENGFVVFSAQDGIEALDVIFREHIDLAIVDIMMPKLDGYKFTKEVRDINQDFPILMVSAKQLPEDRKRGFVAGIDDYMSKPIDPDELILHIKALLRRFKLASEKIIKIGDVVVDYDSFTVTRGEEKIELPQKEFLLFYKLISSPGKIFTRIQLMDEIWGPECETNPETVTVHIGRIRKHFEGWREFDIENVRGLGYRGVIKI